MKRQNSTVFTVDSFGGVAQLSTLGASMKLALHLMVILLMAVALTASAQLFLVKRLVPKNISTDEHFVFAVNKNIGSSAQFAVTVTPKEAAHSFSTDVRVMLFDGTNEIGWMSLNDQRQEKSKPYHYSFDINTHYLAYSQFIFRYSDWTNHISSEDDADSIFFFLRDF